MYDFILINQSIFAKDDGMPDQVGQDGKSDRTESRTGRKVGQDGKSGRTGDHLIR